MEVENDVEFAYVAVILIHLLDVAVHDLEGYQFVIGSVYAGDEEQGCVAPVDNLGVWETRCLSGNERLASERKGLLTFVLEEVTHAGPSREDEGGNVFGDFGLFLGRECGEPFAETLCSILTSGFGSTGRPKQRCS